MKVGKLLVIAGSSIIVISIVFLTYVYTNPSIEPPQTNSYYSTKLCGYLYAEGNLDEYNKGCQDHKKFMQWLEQNQDKFVKCSEATSWTTECEKLSVDYRRWYEILGS